MNVFMTRKHTQKSDLYETRTHNLSPIIVCTNEPRSGISQCASFSVDIIIKSHPQALTKISRKLVKY